MKLHETLADRLNPQRWAEPVATARCDAGRGREGQSAAAVAFAQDLVALSRQLQPPEIESDRRCEPRFPIDDHATYSGVYSRESRHSTSSMA